MAKITINGTAYIVPSGIRLSEALKLESSISVPQPCAGLGRCAKCRVFASGQLSPLSAAEKQHLSEEDIEKGVRLACCTYITGDCEVRADKAVEMTIALGESGEAAATAPAFGKYGAAVDIGTTTLAVALYDTTGTRLAAAGRPNPQAHWGADVISRIQASMSGERESLARAVTSAINELLIELSRKSGIPVSDIDGMVITGNTAMLYLLTATPPDALSRAPFIADRLFGELVPARELGLDCGAEVYLVRCMSAFVGADITSALLASGICRQDGTRMLIDIGTNGEMAIWHNGRLCCCSTAAGPAFEGAGLSMGMPGEVGAIDHVTLDGDRLAAHVIGDAPPRGICGSGIVDALACLMLTEQLDESGLIEDDPTDIAPPVSLTQKDIRMVQLAKSAIHAGLCTLVDNVSLGWDDIAGLSIAGGFGSYLNLESAARIGLLVPELLDRTIVIGNAALGGASMLLLDRGLRAESEKLARSSETVDLSSNPVFTRYYTEGMLFCDEME